MGPRFGEVDRAGAGAGGEGDDCIVVAAALVLPEAAETAGIDSAVICSLVVPKAVPVIGDNILSLWDKGDNGERWRGR
jgi:hypothetical protein